MEMNYENEIKKIIDFHFPRFSELPKVPLYKDQVIIYIESKLMDIKIYEDTELGSLLILSIDDNHKVYIWQE